MKIFGRVLHLQLLLQGIAARTLTTGATGSSGLQLRSGDGGIVDELGPLLSNEADIVLPSSPRWPELLVRAASPRIHPGYVAVVEVATEEDVQHTVRYANRHGMPFLTVSGAHGWPSTINKVHGGIQINMRKMNDTRVHCDGKLATAGGGVMQYEITEALDAHGKQAVTGICECVSAIGPLLGGGHSMLQGRHGFAADNLVSARLVLANGSAVTVSDEENADLFWAVRGAGHNFGVVTSFELKLYDVPDESWNMITLTFTQDKLEAFFDTWNQLEAANQQLGLLLLQGIMARNDTLDPDHPVINVQLISEGVTNPAPNDYATAFRALGPVADSVVTDIAWGELFDVGGFGTQSPVCRKKLNILGYPNSFARWDPAAMRRGFEVFSELMADDTFEASVWLLESYGWKGVQAVPESENAVAPAERRRQILTSPILWWPGDDAVDRRKAESYGEEMQRVVRDEGYVPHSYINYAAGGEKLQEVYGWQAERIARLRRLKEKWDPENRFGFYNPIY